MQHGLFDNRAALPCIFRRAPKRSVDQRYAASSNIGGEPARYRRV